MLDGIDSGVMPTPADPASRGAPQLGGAKFKKKGYFAGIRTHDSMLWGIRSPSP